MSENTISCLLQEGSPVKPAAPCKRNLGGAILLAAIADYRKTNPAVHAAAKAFLFPQSTEERQHFDWVVWMLPGVNPVWLREALDGHQQRWDAQRRLTMRRDQGTSAA